MRAVLGSSLASPLPDDALRERRAIAVEALHAHALAAISSMDVDTIADVDAHVVRARARPPEQQVTALQLVHGHILAALSLRIARARELHAECFLYAILHQSRAVEAIRGLLCPECLSCRF